MTATALLREAPAPAPRVLPIDPSGWRNHAMHAADRHWPQTNCYADLWIEVLHAMGLEPAAAFGFAISQDFEGDQFTFFKPPLEDLESLYGLRVTELALYDDLVSHLALQAAQGRIVLIELDSFYLPDTAGLTYRTAHGKTTVAINRIDPAARELDYFHNEGFWRASGEDFDGLMRLAPGQAREDTLFPYAEMARLPKERCSSAETAAAALSLLVRHIRRRPETNPLIGFRAVVEAQGAALKERPTESFHHYAFNTLRQLGANFELFASHLAWLTREGLEGLGEAEAAAGSIAEGAKIAQIVMARSVRQGSYGRLDGTLAAIQADHDRLIAALTARFPG
ncbi:DUF1839 family protein [Methylopila sp. M107]|uniref:DUF1839 family protein n=1 Tax=Methylopila sp. M107 TaxID=1101190 RepID=UPI00047851CD|nr:DUF1839 family protein [Methylopila sp. M107]